MPIHDLGYRAWDSVRESELLRWSVIAQNGFLRAWHNPWLRRLLFLVWLPAVFFGAVFFLYERAIAYPEMQGLLDGFSLFLPPSFQTVLGEALRTSPEEGRHAVWSALLLTFFRYPQATSMVLVVGFVAPPLISRDIRTKAFLLYFARPISRLEYIFGKMATVWAYVMLITTAPAMALYVLAVMVSPSVEVVAYTWDIPLRVLAATAVLLIPTTALALAFSAITRHTVTAGFLWYAVWVMGGMAHLVLYLFDSQQAVLAGKIEFDEYRWDLLSFYHTLGQVQGFVFHPEGGTTMVALAAASLTLITVLSLALLYWRVSAPMRV
jgi:ABC-type transport system involved in multi-copper enzyme maturation permease subunit